MHTERNENPYAPVEATSAAYSIGKASSIRYRVLILLTLAAAIAYAVRSAMSVTESTMRRELGLSHTQSALLLSAFFWSYALMQVPAGGYSQRYGTRHTLAMYAVLWSAAAVLLGVSQSLPMLISAQLLMGFAQAGIFPAACNSIAEWMPLSRRSSACAVLASGMQIGAIIAGMLTGHLLGFGWRTAFFIYALPGFLWAAWFWWRFRDHPSEDARVSPEELAIIQTDSDRPDVADGSLHYESRFSRWLRYAVHPTLWLLCGQQICRASGYMFFASWFPTFLQETRGVSISQSGILQSMVFTGTLIGSLWGGMLTDLIFRQTRSLRVSRSGVGSLALAGCGVLILASMMVNSVGLAVPLLAVGSLMAALAGPCALSASIDIGGRNVPEVFGLMNMMGNLAAAFCPLAAAYLRNYTGSWDAVLWAFAMIYLLGALCWVFIDSSKKI